MSLIDSLKFHISFFVSSIPIQLNIISFLFFSLLYKLLGMDPDAKRAFPSVESFPSPKLAGKKPCPYANMRDLHEYRRPGPGDDRSPCPALNTMANHGYIPRDGKNLTGTNLTHGLMECYNLSWPLAAFLAWGGVLLLGQVGKLSLYDLARHNRVEHDASLTHANTAPGEEYAPTHSSPELFAAFLEDARDGAFRSTDIARARIRREKEWGTQVTSVQQEIARGEVALVLQIFGGLKFAVPVEVVRTWWGEERLPEGWRPTRKTTLLGTVYWATQIRHAMERMRDAKDVEEEVEVEVEPKVDVKKVETRVNGKTKAKTNGIVKDDEPEQMNRPKYPSYAPATTNGTAYTPLPTRKHSIPIPAAA